jgi:DNA-binding MarR family transcriptional regulator
MTTPHPADPPEPELAARLRIAVARLYRLARVVPQAAGLNASQVATLVALESSAAGLRLSDLAAGEALSPPSATRIVQSLDEQGLVRRRAEPLDRRACIVEITPEGRRTLADFRSQTAGIIGARLGRLSAAERDALASALPALERLGRGEGESPPAG